MPKPLAGLEQRAKRPRPSSGGKREDHHGIGIAPRRDHAGEPPGHGVHQTHAVGVGAEERRPAPFVKPNRDRFLREGNHSLGPVLRVDDGQATIVIQGNQQDPTSMRPDRGSVTTR